VPADQIGKKWAFPAAAGRTMSVTAGLVALERCCDPDTSPAEERTYVVTTNGREIRKSEYGTASRGMKSTRS
jgi:hypothetical protein